MAPMKVSEDRIVVPSPNHAIPRELSRPERDQQSAQAMGENTAWMAEHEAELLRQHSDWRERFCAVASRTEGKILAVCAGRTAAISEALHAPELLEAAEREKLPPDILVSVFLLGVP
jgi:hypothetical protein